MRWDDSHTTTSPARRARQLAMYLESLWDSAQAPVRQVGARRQCELHTWLLPASEILEKITGLPTESEAVGMRRAVLYVGMASPALASSPMRHHGGPVQASSKIVRHDRESRTRGPGYVLLSRVSPRRAPPFHREALGRRMVFRPRRHTAMNIGDSLI